MTPSRLRPAPRRSEPWPHESCYECRLRMPSDDHADAHYRMTGHMLGWPLAGEAEAWPVATDEQVMARA